MNQYNDIIQIMYSSLNNKNAEKILIKYLIKFLFTPLDILIKDIETLKDFISSLNKNLLINVLYKNEINNIIENIDNFKLYLELQYSKQSEQEQQLIFQSPQQTLESFVFEKNKKSIVIDPKDDVFSNNNKSNVSSKNIDLINNNIFYELNIVILKKQYNFDLKFVKQFFRDLIHLIYIINNLKNIHLDILCL